MNIDFTEENQVFNLDKYRTQRLENLIATIGQAIDKLDEKFSVPPKIVPSWDDNHIEIHTAYFILRVHEDIGSVVERRRYKQVGIQMKCEVQAEYLREVARLALEISRFVVGKTFIVE